MGSLPEIDTVNASRRLNALLKAWKEEKEKQTTGIGEVDAVCVVRGPACEELHYRKSVALQLWLYVTWKNKHMTRTHERTHAR